MRTALVLSLVLLAVVAPAAERKPAKDAKKQPPQVTVIFSSGMPVKEMHQRGVANPDTYTCPTPAASSVATIAEALSADLRQRGITVELVPAASVTSASTLVRSPVLVLMGATHFGRADWGIKRVLDERMSGLAVAGLAEQARGKHLFVLGHAEAPQGGAVLGGVQRAVEHNKIPFENAGTYTTQDDTDQGKKDVRGERLATVAKLAGDIAARLDLPR